MHILKRNMPIKRNRLTRLLGFLGKWWPLYFIGLLGTSLQSFAINFIIAIGLDGLASAGLTRDLNLLYRTLSTMGIQLLCVVIALPLFGYSYQSSVKRLTAASYGLYKGQPQRRPSLPNDQ